MKSIVATELLSNSDASLQMPYGLACVMMLELSPHMVFLLANHHFKLIPHSLTAYLTSMSTDCVPSHVICIGMPIPKMRQPDVMVMSVCGDSASATTRAI